MLGRSLGVSSSNFPSVPPPFPHTQIFVRRSTDVIKDTPFVVCNVRFWTIYTKFYYLLLGTYKFTVIVEVDSLDGFLISILDTFMGKKVRRWFTKCLFRMFLVSV